MSKDILPSQQRDGGTWTLDWVLWWTRPPFRPEECVKSLPFTGNRHVVCCRIMGITTSLQLSRFRGLHRQAEKQGYSQAPGSSSSPHCLTRSSCRRPDCSHHQLLYLLTARDHTRDYDFQIPKQTPANLFIIQKTPGGIQFYIIVYFFCLSKYHSFLPNALGYLTQPCDHG